MGVGRMRMRKWREGVEEHGVQSAGGRDSQRVRTDQTWLRLINIYESRTCEHGALEADETDEQMLSIPPSGVLRLSSKY